MNKKEEEKFLKLLKEEDCPAELIDLYESTESQWRKGVIKEFIQDHIWKKGVDKELTYLKKMVWAIFGVTVIAAVSQFFIQYALPLMG